MPVPIICLDDELCHFVERYRQWFSKPQWNQLLKRSKPNCGKGSRNAEVAQEYPL